MDGQRDEDQFSDRQQRFATQFEDGAYLEQEVAAKNVETEIDEANSVLDIPRNRQDEEYRLVAEQQFFRDALGYNPMRDEFKIPGDLEVDLEDEEVVVNYSVPDQASTRVLEHSQNILDESLGIEEADTPHFSWDLSNTTDGYRAVASYTEGADPARNEILERLETAVEILGGERLDRTPRYIN